MNAPGRILQIALLSLPALLGAGCEGIKYMAAVMAPAEKVKPLYNLPADKKILVFVDDIRHPLTYEAVKTDLAQRVGRLLVQHKMAKEVIPPDKLLDLASSMQSFNQMPIPDVGSKLGADLVLYIEIDHFSLRESNDSPLWLGRFVARVKIVDSKVGRIWPEDRPNGFPVPPVETPATANFNESYGAVLATKLAEDMAVRVVNLFREHEKPNPYFE